MQLNELEHRCIDRAPNTQRMEKKREIERKSLCKKVMSHGNIVYQLVSSIILSKINQANQEHFTPIQNCKYVLRGATQKCSVLMVVYLQTTKP